MISGHWFQRKNILLNWAKITQKNNNSLQKGRHFHFKISILVVVRPGNIHTKFKANQI